MEVRIQAFALLLLVSPGSAFAQPQIEIPGGKQFDFGSIFRGTVVDHTVTIRNTGTERLVLKNIEASCGCTGTILAAQEVKPGESTALAITFNSRNFSGNVQKTVTVYSNAANDPRLTIRFTATVVDEIRLSPGHFWFRDAILGSVSTLKVNIRNNGADPLRLTGWRCTLAGFSLTLPNSPIAPGDSADIVAEFTPKRVNPIIADGMFVTTSNPRQPELYIPVYGNAREFKFQ